MNATHLASNVIDAERIVVTSLLAGHPADDILPIVGPDDFFLYGHQIVVRAVSELRNNGKPVGPVSVCDWIRNRGHQDDVSDAFVAELYDPTNPGGEGAYYAKIVRNDSIRRNLVRVLEEKLAEAKQPCDALDVVGRCESVISGLAERGTDGKVYSTAELVPNARDRFDVRMRNKGCTGIPTGFFDLDEKLGGLRDGELNVLAARPSVGKTALMGNIAVSIALRGHPVLIVSLEQNKDELIDRFHSAQGRVSGHRVRGGFSDADTVKKFLRRRRATSIRAIIRR